MGLSPPVRKQFWSNLDRVVMMLSLLSDKILLLSVKWYGRCCGNWIYLDLRMLYGLSVLVKTTGLPFSICDWRIPQIYCSVRKICPRKAAGQKWHLSQWLLKSGLFISKVLYYIVILLIFCLNCFLSRKNSQWLIKVMATTVKTLLFKKNLCVFIHIF